MGQSLCNLGDIAEIPVVGHFFPGKHRMDGVMKIVRPLGIHAVSVICVTCTHHSGVIPVVFGNENSLSTGLLR